MLGLLARSNRLSTFVNAFAILNECIKKMPFPVRIVGFHNDLCVQILSLSPSLSGSLLLAALYTPHESGVINTYALWIESSRHISHKNPFKWNHSINSFQMDFCL